MQFRMTSFADNFEDVVIQRAFDLGSRGFYIDVGAYNPVEHSVTKHFYEQGWRGINIEPNPEPFALLKADRTRDINLNIGLSDHAGELTLFEAPGACWSAEPRLLTGYFAADEADLVRRTVPVQTLAEVCSRHVPLGTTIDFLKVDVEGHELEVFEGGDWSRFRPRIVVAESNGSDTWEAVLREAGYHFTLFDGVNRFYVRDEDARLIPRLKAPANASDCFLIHGYLKRINELDGKLHDQGRELEGIRTELDRLTERCGEIGPKAAKLATRLCRASKRYPRASRLAKRVVSRLAHRG